ncbi:hypothetical protein M501DRAFT_913573, partial [Patellaria atrata CBS 101060]
HHHFNHNQGSGSPVFSPFRHPAMPAIDPNLEAPSQNGRGQLSVHPSGSPHMHHENSTINPQHVPHPYYGDIRSSITPSTPSHNASPRFSGVSPNQQKQVLTSFVPSDRNLPSRDVSDNTLDDAYSTFILYCNPTLAADTDSTELIKNFRTPPKSDGKSFSTWHLFELIRKLDQKEIKTWTQLALDLGVEPPATDKGQSTQKVQQYSVRLKRWMRAMHIDAFFEFLLGKQHQYYLQIPPLHAPYPENGRDGVSLEEDLAIRALDPRFRPKRGRRKAEEDDEFDRAVTPDPKRPHLDTALAFSNSGHIDHPQSAYPGSAYPMSAHPDDFVSHDPWAAAANMGPNTAPNKGLAPHSAVNAGQHIRWRLASHDLPSTPHPLSAVTPISGHHADSAFDEPQSAITPGASKVRSRRRHGPAVSSAWPSNSSTTNGKLRGRPPSNRSVRDGPYVTFPANPKTKEGPTIDLGKTTPTPTPSHIRAQSESSLAPQENQIFRFPPEPPPPPASQSQSAVPQSATSQTPTNPPSGRPGLQLQVPQHVGGPVHLITPTVLVNGETNPQSGQLAPSAFDSGASRRSSPNFFEDSDAEHDGFPPILPKPQPRRLQQQTPVSTFPSNPPHSLKRALAADLLRADIVGRKRLRGSEAKGLADAVLRQLRPSAQNEASDQISEDSKRISNASWLGLGQQVGLGNGGPVGGMKKVVCRRFRVSGDGYESPIDEDEEIPEGEVKESFDVSWGLLCGSVAGEFVVRGIVVTDGVEVSGEKMKNEDKGDWREKYERAKQELRKMEEEVLKMREKVLDAVL